MLMDEQTIRAIRSDVKRWTALWPADGPGPMGAEPFDAALAVAIAAADHITAAWDRLTAAIEATAGAVVYDVDSARAIQDLDVAWLVPARRALDRLADLERLGEPVGHAARFRELVGFAESATSVSVEEVGREAEWFARQYPDVPLFPITGPTPQDAAHAV